MSDSDIARRPTVDEQTYTKADVLQVLLDTQQMCLDLFDACEAETLRADADGIARLSKLVDRLDAIRQGFMQQYVFSCRAGNDLLTRVRSGLASRHRPPSAGSDR